MDKYKNVFELKLIKNKCTGNGLRFFREIFFFGFWDLSRATSVSLHKATLQTKISEKADFITKQNDHTQWHEKKQEFFLKKKSDLDSWSFISV